MITWFGESHFLVPEITHSLPSLYAYVCMPPTSLPANASLIARQMNFFPAKMSGTILACNSGEPKLRTGGKPITSPANKPSIYPRVPHRPNSVLMISWMFHEVQERAKVRSELLTSWKWSNSSGETTPPRSVLPFRCLPGPRRMPMMFSSLFNQHI